MPSHSVLNAAAQATPAHPPGHPVLPAQPQGCTNLKLRQLMRRVGRFYDAEVGKTGLKGTQYSLLSYVLRLGPIRPGDLAAHMGVDSSTLTRNLRPLIDHGWVELGPGADARSRLVSITPAGRELRAQAQRRWKVAQQSLNALLDPAQVAALHALIDDALTRFDYLDTGGDPATEDPDD